MPFPFVIISMASKCLNVCQELYMSINPSPYFFFCPIRNRMLFAQPNLAETLLAEAWQAGRAYMYRNKYIVREEQIFLITGVKKNEIITRFPWVGTQPQTLHWSLKLEDWVLSSISKSAILWISLFYWSLA